MIRGAMTTDIASRHLHWPYHYHYEHLSLRGIVLKWDYFCGGISVMTGVVMVTQFLCDYRTGRDGFILVLVIKVLPMFSLE